MSAKRIGVLIISLILFGACLRNITQPVFAVVAIVSLVAAVWAGMAIPGALKQWNKEINEDIRRMQEEWDDFLKGK